MKTKTRKIERRNHREGEGQEEIVVIGSLCSEINDEEEKFIYWKCGN